MRPRYTTEQLEFVRIGYKSMQIPELTAAFNNEFSTEKTATQIKSVLSNHGFKCGRKTGNKKGSYWIFTKEQAQFIQENYNRLSRQDLTAALNKRFNIQATVRQVISFTKNHGIKSGRTGCFEKGNKSWNTGTKGLVKPNSGNFNKGNIPANIKPLGHERICSKDGYILIKVAEPNPYTGADTRYRHKQQVVWEAENGPIPAGHIVSFKDGDRINCEPDNLVLLSRNELRYLNYYGYSEMPTEMRESMRALAKLETRRFELKKTTEQNHNSEMHHGNK